MFTVRTRSSDSRARTGALRLAHGEVQTPAFVPLATRGAVRTLEPRDVEALGYEMVLGNTFHLFLSPGPELIAEFGGLNRFMRWRRPIITDSGGFQVFSMGHGGVADEIKGRGRPQSDGAILAIKEEGVRFPLLRRRLGAVPGARDLDVGPGRARLGHRACVRRVHAVPRLARVHGAVDGAHASLARAVPALARATRTAEPGGVRNRPGRRRPRAPARVERGHRR